MSSWMAEKPDCSEKSNYLNISKKNTLMLRPFGDRDLQLKYKQFEDVNFQRLGMMYYSLYAYIGLNYNIIYHLYNQFRWLCYQS